MPQKLPENSHLRIRPLLCRKIRRAHHEHRRIQNTQHALHLRREVRMSRRVQNRKRTIPDPEPRQLRVDRDPPLFLHLIRIQKRISVIDASPFFHCTRLKQNALG